MVHELQQRCRNVLVGMRLWPFRCSQQERLSALRGTSDGAVYVDARPQRLEQRAKCVVLLLEPACNALFVPDLGLQDGVEDGVRETAVPGDALLARRLLGNSQFDVLAKHGAGVADRRIRRSVWTASTNYLSRGNRNTVLLHQVAYLPDGSDIPAPDAVARSGNLVIQDV